MNLNSGEIHIWSAKIDERYKTLLTNSNLSFAEIRRAKKFSFDIDSYIYTVRHNLLRIILGQYLNCQPSTILFKNNQYQKPHIIHPITKIQFNISISSNRFIAAFCLDHFVGIDIELNRQIDGFNQIIADYFTVHEAAIVLKQENFLEKAFFNIWTRKEAVVKAIGKGVDIPMKMFDVVLDKYINIYSEDWFITQLNIFDDCSASLVTNHPNARISNYKISDILI